MKNLIIFEPLCRGYEHLSFNAAGFFCERVARESYLHGVFKTGF